MLKNISEHEEEGHSSSRPIIELIVSGVVSFAPSEDNTLYGF